MVLTLSKIEVLWVPNELVFAFYQIFELFIPRPHFVPEKNNYFLSLFLDAFLKLSKLVFNPLEVVLKFLEYAFCLLGDNSIDWGRNVCHCLREENLNYWIFSLIDEFSLNFNDRLKHSLDSLLRLHLVRCFNVASSQRLSAESMKHYDKICTEVFRDISRQMLFFDQVMIS